MPKKSKSGTTGSDTRDLMKKIIEKENEIKRLNSIMKTKDDYITHLEKVSEAYNALATLATKERKEADEIIEAQELIREYMVKEIKNAEDVIHAHESLHGLAVKEKIQAEATIRALENVEMLSDQEKLERERVIEAQQKILELSDHEKRSAADTIKARENLQYLTDIERQEAQQIIQAREHLSELTMMELSQRDTALRNVLEINHSISSLTEADILFDKILRSLVQSLNAQRGILFISNDVELHPESLYRLELRDLAKKSFRFSSGVIDEVIRTKKSKMIVNQKIRIGRKNYNISILCVPLTYENKSLGVIYLDTVSDSDTFKHLDLEVAEIFSSQASISVNNIALYNRIRLQNDELLKLINLKTQFMSHVSEYLAHPVANIQKQLQKLIDDTTMSPDVKQKALLRILAQVNKFDNTVNKVLTIASIEQEVNDLFADRVNFARMCREIIDRHSEEREKRKVTVTMNFSPEFQNFLGNETVIRTILDELISNAIFYNKPNGIVDIRGYQKDDFLTVDIIDTGQGIRDKDLDNIFAQFYRTEESATFNEWGAGLGLYMVKTFIGYYGGSVKLKSKYGRGSTFSISFLIH
jgi:signal transduction histidine kinase